MQFSFKYCAIVMLISLTSLCSNTAHSEEQNYQIPYVNQSAVIDGELTDDIWKKAKEIPLTIVNSPWNNKPSPVTTVARLVENGEFIYISFIAKTRKNEEVKAFLGDRDSRWSDDIVGIKLDTFNTRRLNYEFFVNAYGVQHDGINNEMTQTPNRAWDGIWDSFGKLIEDGYQVEMAIPYGILNFENSKNIKTWAFELIRLYPDDTKLRISNQEIDRNNDCWLCQSPEISGFKNAKASKNLMLTPAVVATKNESRDIYNPSDEWHSNNNVDAGLDLRWNINSNNLLNATINPDFSTVESDAGQLNINKTFSLFYDEKRPFFLDNADYFSSNFDLVYTRNIADPDYGAKVTGTEGAHSYGVFVTNDTETNFIVPGNTGSNIASLAQDSHSAAMRYRYDINEDFSIGTVSTLRDSDQYHNYVVGIDGNYRINESNQIKAQLLGSNTQYPTDLYQSFCYGSAFNDCDKPQQTECSFGNCAYTEQVHRSNKQDDFSDHAFLASYEHSSEYWGLLAEHKQVGKDFRADLGFMTLADYQANSLTLDRFFYGDEHTPWQEVKVSGSWQIKHNENGELLEKNLQSLVGIDGPMQSYFELILNYDDKIGLRHDETQLTIDNNATLFTEKAITLYGQVEPGNNLLLQAEFIAGDKIDYNNNRLGDYQEIFAGITYSFTEKLSGEFYYTDASLDADKQEVYQAKLSELRLSYQFNVHSYLKLNLVYSDIDRNPDNNPFVGVSARNNDLSTQLIYAYKLNPQTVFYLGYSDSSYQDDYLDRLTREQRTFFTKISYAWLP
ncbi:DUF5916 domain-containing protein [Thalassotalea sp. 1_MG-2023]|uniref:carbohydrate binding family 9 domain-containing protein n=1 Tax=Thalassotalea sp. 1_MG-2023 TaxID=3062680 RepID=UPI0026E2A802|nr:DUF5916 domain-containing protein [Thalassotalea sp. 1_MG-2023]MDO6428295.1 DUF5916 domain-containing protein [Thalassotalea sp. 1_MG-2023]